MDEWIEVAAKIVVYASALTGVGVVGVRLLLSRSGQRGRVAAPDMELRLETLRLGASGVLLLGVGARAWVHTAAAFGLAGAFDVANLYTVAIESRWGGGWQAQAIGALVLGGAAAWARRPRAGLAETGVADLAALAVCFALPRTGHAASEPYGWLLHGTHVLAAGLWVGTLACILMLRSPETRRARPALLHAFAPIAMTAVAALGASGAIAAWIYLGALSALWTSEYGAALLLKVAIVLAMLVLGGINWRALHRRDTKDVPRTVLLEAGLAIAVIVVTGWLTETAHP